MRKLVVYSLIYPQQNNSNLKQNKVENREYVNERNRVQILTRKQDIKKVYGKENMPSFGV